MGVAQDCCRTVNRPALLGFSFVAAFKCVGACELPGLLRGEGPEEKKKHSEIATRESLLECDARLSELVCQTWRAQVGGRIAREIEKL